MENARIIIIEDNDRLRNACRRNLEASDHKIIGEATSISQAQTLVESLRPEDVDIAVIDGNLGSGSGSGVDGERVANLIHKKLPGVIVVGSSLDGHVRGADINVPKGDAWALDVLVAQIER